MHIKRLCPIAPPSTSKLAEAIASQKRGALQNSFSSTYKPQIKQAGNSTTFNQEVTEKMALSAPVPKDFDAENADNFEDVRLY